MLLPLSDKLAGLGLIALSPSNVNVLKGHLVLQLEQKLTGRIANLVLLACRTIKKTSTRVRRQAELRAKS